MHEQRRAVQVQVQVLSGRAQWATGHGRGQGSRRGCPTARTEAQHVPAPAPAPGGTRAQVFLQGLDKTGRPIVLGVGSRHRKFETKEDALAFCTYALDTACAIGNSHEEWDGKLTGVFDLRSERGREGLRQGRLGYGAQSAGRSVGVACGEAPCGFSHDRQ